MSATIEIQITPPGPPGTRPWWTLRWDGVALSVETAPELEGDEPGDWGITCTSPAYTDAWRDEGGTPYVIEQILDGFTGAGAQPRIVAVQGDPETRRETLAALRAFVDEHPQCAADLRRFVADTEPGHPDPCSTGWYVTDPATRRRISRSTSKPTPSAPRAGSPGAAGEAQHRPTRRPRRNMRPSTCSPTE